MGKKWWIPLLVLLIVVNVVRWGVRGSDGPEEKRVSADGEKQRDEVFLEENIWGNRTRQYSQLTRDLFFAEGAKEQQDDPNKKSFEAPTDESNSESKQGNDLGTRLAVVGTYRDGTGAKSVLVDSVAGRSYIVGKGDAVANKYLVDSILVDEVVIRDQNSGVLTRLKVDE